MKTLGQIAFQEVGTDEEWKRSEEDDLCFYLAQEDWEGIAEVVRVEVEREIAEWLRRVTRDLPADAPADYNCAAALIIDGEYRKETP